MRFPPGTFAAVDRLAGKGKRAAFIRQAVDEKIEAAARELGIERAAAVQGRRK